MKNIYVTAFPKSGSTWLTRLLADCLNCPAGGSLPDDETDWVVEGEDRPNHMWVRRGHFTFTSQDGCMIPQGHKINLDHYDDSPFVLLVRDPRDVAVSLSYHFNRPMSFGVEMLSEGYKRWGMYGEYCLKWIDTHVNLAYVRYEDLLTDPIWEVGGIFLVLDIPFDPNRLPEACLRQSFAVRKAQISNLSHQEEKKLRQGRKFHLRFMRKGIAGDWKNHLTAKQAKRIVEANKEFMRMFEYEH
jgi:hypothetical protein